MADHDGVFTSQPRPEPVVHNGKVALRNIINQGKFSDEGDLWDASPIRLWHELQDDPAFFLEIMFQPNNLVWIGEHDEPGILGETIRSASEWIHYFHNGGKTSPHIIINPLSGMPVPTKSGDKTTLRGDRNVTKFLYVLVEFDDLLREEQLRFWSAIRLPVVALIDSGGKSIHAWLDVSNLAGIATTDDWQTHIKSNLFDRLLTPLGVDGACKNPARLSRLPGHYRTKKGKFQRLLWLSPEGRPVSC
jgi:hypothetical protein